MGKGTDSSSPLICSDPEEASNPKVTPKRSLHILDRASGVGHLSSWESRCVKSSPVVLSSLGQE